MMDDNSSNKINFYVLISSIGFVPFFLIGVTLFIVILFVFDLFEGNNNIKNNFSFESQCNYEETMVTVMDGSNTRVLATVSLEDYIIGVACVEIGACSGASSSIAEHYVKAQYIASKTYVLASRGYNSNTKSITVRASTRNQQWCDLKTGCIITKENGSIYHNTYPGNYDKSKIKGTIIGTRKFTDKDLEVFHKYYRDTYGELFLSTSYKSTIATLGSKDVTQYKATTQNYWNSQAKNGVTYDRILKNTGSASVSDNEDYVGKSIYKLNNYCKSTGIGSGNLVELSKYPSTTALGKTQEINRPIGKMLSSNQIEDLNAYIVSSVNQAGYGTGGAVATAGQSLIYGLYQYGYHLPYWYGGGHSKGIKIGVDSYWGTHGKFDSSWWYWNSSRGRTIYSYDCSAFVSWSIKNACKSNYSGTTSSGFSGYGSGISLKNAKPGDLMVKSGSHVRLIVKNTGDGVIAAESTSGFIKHGGILFKEYKSAGGYKIVDMTKWYKNNCNSSR